MSGRAQKRGKSKPFWPCFLRLPVVSISRYVLHFSLSYCKTGKKTFQLVLHCKTSCKAMLCTLTPTFKPVLQQINFLQVVWILTFDWIKLCECHTIQVMEFMSIVATQVYFGLENTQNVLQILSQRGVVLITISLLRTSDITQWCDFTFFSYIVSRCIINEKSPKIS